MAVKPIPDKYNTVTPYLVVSDIVKLEAFLKHTFGAVETERITLPTGAVNHAEMRIGHSIIMMGATPDGQNATSAMLYVYVENTDATYKRALDAGGISIVAPADQAYGDRTAGVRDSFGNQWWIATHVEDVSHEEMMKRIAARSKKN